MAFLPVFSLAVAWTAWSLRFAFVRRKARAKQHRRSSRGGGRPGLSRSNSVTHLRGEMHLIFDKAMLSSIIILFVLHVLVTKTALSLFSCTSYIDAEIEGAVRFYSFLERDADVQCYSGSQLNWSCARPSRTRPLSRRACCVFVVLELCVMFVLSCSGSDSGFRCS